MFPYEVCATESRIDMFLMSKSKKICIAGPELTVPFEENLITRRVMKTQKYEDVFSNRSPEWQFHLLTVEIGSRGYVGESFTDTFRKLGFTHMECNQLRDSCSLMARRCSYVIWVHRANKEWSPIRFTLGRQAEP